MEDFEGEPDVRVARLLARIRPRWDAVRTERNLNAILDRLRGPKRWRRAWNAMLAATRMRYRTSAR
ncbi:MAG TPA: hypothetical protein VN903_25265 [Polyangia bacterium]|jgi:hypothetical protein|nr:hypothetical protein [Polyangia bacterium]